MTTDINTRLIYTITSRSISFYHGGRMHSLSADSTEFADLRAALQTPIDQPHDKELILSLVDVRAALAHKSKGEIVYDEQTDSIIWQGVPLKNIWVEKILDYRKAGEDYTPIWNALQRLVKNPTEAAIQRLPIFLERTQLGFLPDGRFLAFKGVTANYMSAYGGNFRHLVGDECRMPRSAVDPDPNQTCSRGLHVGAPGYVRQNYSGGTYALVLVAVGPEDVVAVPTDYQGEKMRVCGYEVIDHLSQDYNDELLGRLKTTTSHGYAGKPTATSSTIASEAKVGDRVEYGGDEDLSAGQYVVVQVDTAASGGCTLCCSDGWLRDNKVISILPVEEPSIYMQIVVGEVISYRDGDGEKHARVVKIDENDDENRIQVVEVSGVLSWVGDSEFDKLVYNQDVTGAMVAYDGCKITIAGHEMLRDGEYEITGLCDEPAGYQDDGDGEVFAVGNLGIPVTNGCIQVVVSPSGEQIFPLPVSVYSQLKVDDVVEYGWGKSTQFGRVVEISEARPNIRLVDGELYRICQDEFIRKVEEEDITADMVTFIGCLIHDGEDAYHVTATNTYGDVQGLDEDEFFAVNEPGNRGPVTNLRNDAIQVVSFEGEHLWPRPYLTAKRLTENTITADKLSVGGRVRAKVGDRIVVKADRLPAGSYLVAEVHAFGYVVETEHDGLVNMSEDLVTQVVAQPWTRARPLDIVTLSAWEGSAIPAGRYEVCDSVKGEEIQVRGPQGPWWVYAERVIKVEPKA